MDVARADPVAPELIAQAAVQRPMREAGLIERDRARRRRRAIVLRARHHLERRHRVEVVDPDAARGLPRVVIVLLGPELAEEREALDLDDLLLVLAVQP